MKGKSSHLTPMWNMRSDYTELPTCPLSAFKEDASYSDSATRKMPQHCTERHNTKYCMADKTDK